MFTKEHEGRRVMYTDRSNKQHPATIKEVIESIKQLNIHRDDLQRERYYVPFDMCVLTDED